MIYRNDAIARARNLSPEERLLFHQAESGPTMEELHVWLVRQFDERQVEPNSALGGAISYLLRHWEKLTLFLRVPGAPLDNNICEKGVEEGASRLIRLIALVRRAKPRLDWGSSHFSSWRDGVSLQCQHLKEESHVEAHWEGPPRA